MRVITTITVIIKINILEILDALGFAMDHVESYLQLQGFCPSRVEEIFESRTTATFNARLPFLQRENFTQIFLRFEKMIMEKRIAIVVLILLFHLILMAKLIIAKAWCVLSKH